MNKFLTATFLMILTVFSTVGALAASPGKLRYYYCYSTMVQRVKLIANEDIQQVLDKNSCVLVSDLSIDKAVQTALKETATKTRSGGYGFFSPEKAMIEISKPHVKKAEVVSCDGEDEDCLAQGTLKEKIDSLFVFTEKQALQIADNLVWAKQYGRSLSIYFMEHQTAFRRRGEPNPILLYNLQEAALVVESPSFND